jgi:hypothetical protein
MERFPVRVGGVPPCVADPYVFSSQQVGDGSMLPDARLYGEVPDEGDRGN